MQSYLEKFATYEKFSNAQHVTPSVAESSSSSFTRLNTTTTPGLAARRPPVPPSLPPRALQGETSEASNQNNQKNQNNLVKCYSCVGDWPNRNCYPLYNEEECVNGTYTEYDSCTRMCGTSYNRPTGIVVEEAEAEAEEAEEAETEEVEEVEETVTNNQLSNKINKALNNKLKNHRSFKQNATNSDIFDHMDKMYKNYVNALPYDVPKTFSFSIFLTIVIAFTVCNLVLSFYGAKSIGSCGGKNVLMVVFTSLFLIFSWVGHVLPYYGNIASLLSMVITIVLILVSGTVCK
jgi:hypothetical protein